MTAEDTSTDNVSSRFPHGNANPGSTSAPRSPARSAPQTHVPRRTHTPHTCTAPAAHQTHRHAHTCTRAATTTNNTCPTRRCQMPQPINQSNQPCTRASRAARRRPARGARRDRSRRPACSPPAARARGAAQPPAHCARARARHVTTRRVPVMPRVSVVDPNRDVIVVVVLMTSDRHAATAAATATTTAAATTTTTTDHHHRTCRSCCCPRRPCYCCCCCCWRCCCCRSCSSSSSCCPAVIPPHGELNLAACHAIACASATGPARAVSRHRALSAALVHRAHSLALALPDHANHFFTAVALLQCALARHAEGQSGRRTHMKSEGCSSSRPKNALWNL